LKNFEGYYNNNPNNPSIFDDLFCLMRDSYSYPMIYLWVEESSVNDLSILPMLAHTSPLSPKVLIQNPLPLLNVDRSSTLPLEVD